MKALYLTGKAQVEMRDIDIPKCPDDGLLIKIDAVGLCGSDVRTYSVGSAKIDYPVILGHENAGIVAEAGCRVAQDYKAGDKVVANPAIPCGKCYYCVNKMPGLCDNLEVAGTSFPGGFAQYMVFPGNMLERGQIIKVPQDRALESMVLSELLASVIKAQDDLKVGLGETVVIIGTGPIGCLHAMIARLHGAANIVMADINRGRLELCRNFGTHFVVSSEEDLVARVMEITGGRGADVCISANPSPKPHQQGVEMLRKEGRLSLFGGLPKESSMTTVDGNLIHYKRLRVFGAYSYSAADFQKGYELLQSGKIDTGVITHALPLDRMEEGVRLIQKGEAIKVVLKPWEYSPSVSKR